jgi:hypothetical protein
MEALGQDRCATNCIVSTCPCSALLRLRQGSRAVAARRAWPSLEFVCPAWGPRGLRRRSFDAHSRMSLPAARANAGQRRRHITCPLSLIPDLRCSGATPPSQMRDIAALTIDPANFDRLSSKCRGNRTWLKLIFGPFCTRPAAVPNSSTTPSTISANGLMVDSPHRLATYFSHSSICACRFLNALPRR